MRIVLLIFLKRLFRLVRIFLRLHVRCQEIVKERYIYQRALLNEVVYNILYTASDKPLKERVNFKQLDYFLNSELKNNGVDIPYHFTVTDRDNKEIYRCSDYEYDNEKVYSRLLFEKDPPAKMGFVNVFSRQWTITFSVLYGS